MPTLRISIFGQMNIIQRAFSDISRSLRSYVILRPILKSHIHASLFTNERLINYNLIIRYSSSILMFCITTGKESS